jgi:DNA-binding transcriptional LysR family regulator
VILNIGLGLFSSNGRNGGTRPTLAGAEFLDAARRIIEETEAITTRLQTRARGESGRLMIGVHASLSAGNLRATLVELRRRFPEVHTHLVDGSSNDLISNLANSNVGVAFVVGGNATWDGRSLSVWSERVVVVLPEHHPLINQDVIHWADLEHELLLSPQRGPGPEFFKLLIGKIACSEPCRILRHDVALDRPLTLVGAGWGILVALRLASIPWRRDSRVDRITAEARHASRVSIVYQRSH